VKYIKYRGTMWRSLDRCYVTSTFTVVHMVYTGVSLHFVNW